MSAIILTVKRAKNLTTTSPAPLCSVWTNDFDKQSSQANINNNIITWNKRFYLSCTPSSTIHIKITDEQESETFGQLDIPFESVTDESYESLKWHRLDRSATPRGTKRPKICLRFKKQQLYKQARKTKSFTVTGASGSNEFQIEIPKRDLIGPISPTNPQSLTRSTSCMPKRPPPAIPEKKQVSRTNSMKQFNSDTNLMMTFLTSEQEYVEQLEIIVRTLLLPTVQKKILSLYEIQHMFLNLNEILRINKVFLTKLQKHKKSTDLNILIDYVVEHVNQLGPYVDFCRRQHEAIEFFESTYKTNLNFQKFIEKGNSEWKEFSPQELLSAPLQRLTRYPSLINEIQAVVPPNSEQSNKLRTATQKISTIVEKVNTVVRNERDVKLTHHVWTLLSESASCFGYLKDNVVVIANLGLMEEPVLYYKSPKVISYFPIQYQRGKQNIFTSGTVFIFEHSLFIVKGQNRELAPLGLIPLRSLNVEERTLQPSHVKTANRQQSETVNTKEEGQVVIDYETFKSEFISNENKFLGQIDRCKLVLASFLMHEQLQDTARPLVTHLSKIQTQFRCVFDELGTIFSYPSNHMLEFVIGLTQRLGLVENYGKYLLEILPKLYELSSINPIDVSEESMVNMLKILMKICEHPSRYRSTMEYLVRQLNLTDKTLLGTLKLVETSVNMIERLTRLYNDALKVLAINQQVQSNESLFATGRQFLYEGDLKRLPANEIIHCFLFNNLLVCCSKTLTGSWFTDHRIDLLCDDLGLIPLGELSFQILKQTSNQSLGMFEALSYEDHVIWVDHLQAIADNMKQTDDSQTNHQNASSYANQELIVSDIGTQYTVRFASDTDKQNAFFQIQNTRRSVLTKEVTRIAPFFMEHFPDKDALLNQSQTESLSSDDLALYQDLASVLANEVTLLSLARSTLELELTSKSRLTSLSAELKTKVVGSAFSRAGDIPRSASKGNTIRNRASNRYKSIVSKLE